MRRQIEEDTTPTTPQNSEPLHTKYRPRALKEVVGQNPVVKSLESMLKAKARPHTFFFTGPAGTGKTTLARILAAEFQCDVGNIIEVDAASTSGIDDMRAITSTLRYNGFGAHPNKAIIIDECHRLSKQAWDSLLKSTEEPPPHVFFFFCSTEPSKIPTTMQTRGPGYNLKPVRGDDLFELMDDVCSWEKLVPVKGLLDLIADTCGGSPRQALVMLGMTHDCETLTEAERLLEAPLDNKESIELCRALISGQLAWPTLVKILKGLDEEPESIRIIVVNYLNACLIGARSDRDAVRLLGMLECFTKPCNPSDKLAPILIAFGRYIFP